MATEDQKKVLVLHGFLQTGEHMQLKSGQLRKLGKGFNFIYPDGAIKIETKDGKIEYSYNQEVLLSNENNRNIPDSAEPRFGWFSVNIDDYTQKPLGLDQSLERFKQLLKDHNPTHIIGFSQGASLILYAMAQKVVDDKYKLAVVSPFYPNNNNWLHGDNSKIFICYGTTDQVTGNNENSSYAKLKEDFPNATIYIHEGGHYIPADKNAKPFWQEFFQ